MIQKEEAVIHKEFLLPLLLLPCMQSKVRWTLILLPCMQSVYRRKISSCFYIIRCYFFCAFSISSRMVPMESLWVLLFMASI